jgi:hypothetical protein
MAASRSLRFLPVRTSEEMEVLAHWQAALVMDEVSVFSATVPLVSVRGGVCCSTHIDMCGSGLLNTEAGRREVSWQFVRLLLLGGGRHGFLIWLLNLGGAAGTLTRCGRDL